MSGIKPKSPAGTKRKFSAALQPLKPFATKLSARPKAVRTISFVGAFAFAGIALLVLTHAATNSAFFEPETGARTGNAVLASDTGASGGSAILFGANGSNILQGKVFTANVADSTTETGNPITNLTDGNDNTRWISQPTRPVVATVDMAGIYTLNRVQVVWAANTIKDFTIQVSSDNSSWTTITTGVTDNTAKQDVNYTSFTATAKGRYLRINGTSAWNSAFGNSVWEVRAYGTLESTVPDPPNPPNPPAGGLPELGFSLNGEALSGPLQQAHYNELATFTPYAEWARVGFSSDGDWQTTSQRYFDAATNAGMKVLLRASFPGNQYNGSQPVNVSAYGDFVAAMAARYKAKGLGGTNPVMELPNEINGTSITGATYAAAACNAYPKLKAVDPNYKIIGASENVYASNWKVWLEDVYKGGFANCSDGVSFHNYDAPGDGARYDFLRSLMTKYNDLDAKVWVTEFGATTCTPASSSPLGCRTEQQQADKLVGNIRDMRDKYPWITHALVYSDEDVPSRKTTDAFEAYFGIYRNDASGNITGAKPAVAALKALYKP